MFITRHRLSVEAEFIRWMVLIIASLAILLVIASALAAERVQRALAAPMATEPLSGLSPAAPMERPFFPEDPPPSQREAVDMAARLWMILEHQRAGGAPDVLARWEQIRLPSHTAVWREIGMAAALLQAGDLQPALMRLDAAETIAPHHPVVAFLRGKIWLELAQLPGESTPRWPLDEPGRLLPSAPRFAPPVYEVMAIAEFQEAVEYAGLIEPRDLLVAQPRLAGQRDAGPSVGDLLAAIDCDRFEGRAHRLLFTLHLRRGEVVFAEQELDQSAEAGLAASGDHFQLTAALADLGDREAATRVLGKGLWLHYPSLCRGWLRLTGSQAGDPWVW